MFSINVIISMHTTNLFFFYCIKYELFYYKIIINFETPRGVATPMLRTTGLGHGLVGLGCSFAYDKYDVLMFYILVKYLLYLLIVFLQAFSVNFSVVNYKNK